MVKSMLRRKLLRDMVRQGGQFLAIILLCTLGTFAFSVLDGTSRMTRVTIDTYFERNRLADYWVNMPEVDDAALTRMRNLPGVADAVARHQADLETTLGEGIKVSLTACDGEMTVNIPEILEGEMLDPADARGCLLDQRFAGAHGISVGDRLTVKLGSERISFPVRGICMSPEYVVVSNHIATDAASYGYILVNARAVPQLPLSQMVVAAEAGADRDALRKLMEKTFPRAIIVARGTHPSTVSIENDAQMFANMTGIFPLLAYFIACMIVMTTLSRMIDGQRLQMGTLKALGFPARKIRNHYLSYAILPSLIGAMIGLLVGHWTLPDVLWDALMGQSELPYRLRPPISVPAWSMVALTVALATGICWFSYRKASRESAAALLRPKPPKEGRRVLLERIPPLWKRMGFNAKTVSRNLLRNKLRSFMFLLGILFCNMLLILSLGLQDSVTRMTTEQYGKVMRATCTATFEGGADTAESYERRLAAERVECVMTKSIRLRAGEKERTTQLTVLEDEQQLQCLGKGAVRVALPEGAAAVTEKLAEVMGISAGDTLEITLAGEKIPVLLQCDQIVYNNFSQGIYLNRSVWDSLRKGEFIPTSVHLLNETPDAVETLRGMDEVDRIDFPQDLISETRKMLDTLTTVFLVLEGIALALAFVICYNMGLMNFTERTREYATLKVLGYHQREIRRLILSENIILTTLGMLLGILPGYQLTYAVMRVCESEMTRYTAWPETLTVVICCGISFGFSLLIQLLLTRNVKKIDMVEALKSVE